jgi:hypothetical protein
MKAAKSDARETFEHLRRSASKQESRSRCGAFVSATKLTTLSLKLPGEALERISDDSVQPPMGARSPSFGASFLELYYMQ